CWHPIARQRHNTLPMSGHERGRARLFKFGLADWGAAARPIIGIFPMNISNASLRGIASLPIES
ncbi:MAG: hypothetical protein NXI22_24280, partial [bacterium]|nr:hypothetical protein [bacterium]